MKPSLLNISKTMAFATAIGAASAAWATQYLGVLPGSTDFESGTFEGDGYMILPNEGDASIEPGSSGFADEDRPANYRYNDSTNYVLSVETSADAPVFRKLNADGTNEVGTIYVDMLVKPTAIFAPDASPTPGSTDKLLVYFKEYPAGTTNLCVYAGYLDNETLTQGECFLSSQLPVDKDTWYRLVIKAKLLQEAYPGFNVYLGGYGQQFICTSGGNADFYSLLVNVDTPVAAPSEVAKVGFAGSGFVDDFVASTNDPGQPAELAPNFTLTWPEGFTPVSYTVGGETNILSGASSPLAINVSDGAVVAFTFRNADGATKTMSVTAAEGTVEGIDASTATFGWAEYLGDAVDGAYQIDDAADLNMLRKGVAAGLATTGETFKQTANIDFANATFAGIGTYADNPTAGTPFAGSYDGQGYKISNIAFEAKSYAGVFNQVNGGTIKNLTVENATGANGISIVGNAGNGATLQNLVAEGSFGSSSAPAGHNAAGIAIRLSAGGAGTLVKDCTNNATIYGTYTKLAGICTLTQVKVSGGAVTFDGCVNNGNLIMPSGSTAGRDGLAGIVAYAQDNTILTNCSNTGTISSVLSTAKKGELIGYAYEYVITDKGNNSASSSIKMIGYQNNPSWTDDKGVSHTLTINGFKYATVANGVATTIAGAPVAGGTYLLEGNVAASETPVATLTAVGDTIAFNTALGYTFAGTVGNSGAAGIPVASTSGTVTTYTAGYFPRTATPGQDGSAANPFEIADVDDLQALAAYTAGQSLCYVQVANIDMTSAGTFPGIGGDFTGTYDGGNYTISNIEFAANTYRGLFNKVTGATIKNLKIDTVTFAAAASGVEFGGSAFVGKVYGNTVLSNLTAKGSVGSALAPANHSIAGVATRVYGQNVKFFDCANEASVYGEVRKVAGVLGIIQGTASVDFIGCSNSGAIVTTTVTHHDIGDNKDYTTGADGLAGIIAYANAPTTLKDCVNTGAIQINSGNTGASVGELIGKCGSTTITDLGGNKGASDKKMIGTRAGTITGFQYATVESSVATTIASPYTVAAGNTYLLEGNATPVVELADGESIAFNTALGYTLTDTGITAAEGLTLTDETVGTVKTYTAAAAAPSIPAWATDVTNESVIDQAVSDKYADWADKVAGSGADLTQDRSAQFLMNVPVAAEVALTIDGIEVTSDGTIVTIGATKTIDGTTTPITLGTTDAGVDTPAINGILNVVVADSISGLSSTTAKKAIPAANLVFVNGKAEVLIPATDGKFVKASVDYSTPASAITEVTE